MKVNPFTLAIPDDDIVEVKISNTQGIEVIFTFKRPGVPEMSKIGDLSEKMCQLYLGEKALPFFALSNGVVPKLSEGEIILACTIFGLQVENNPQVDFYNVEEIIALFYTMKEGMAQVALKVNELTNRINELFENPTKGSQVEQLELISDLPEETQNLMHG